MRVKIQLVENGIMPTKGTEQAACFDTYVRKIEREGSMYKCYLGFKTEIPVGYEGVLKPRSSNTKTRFVMTNSPGTIDSDFRGEWQARFTAMEEYDEDGYTTKLPYKAGDRVAQLCFRETLKFDFELTNELNDTERGEGGHGSTGK